jgi:hypothetical protein
MNWELQAASDISRDELIKLIADDSFTGGGPLAIAINELCDKVTARGGGIAVYTNQDWNDVLMGSLKFASFGHPDAQLEDADPPELLPDIGAQINWRCVLTYIWRPAPPTE